MGKDSEILMDVILHDPQWLEILIAGIADGILILDLDGIVHYVNEGYLHISGLKREQIIGRRLSDVRPGALLPKVVATGKPMADIYRKEGNTEYVADLAPLYKNGEIIGGVGVLKDMNRLLDVSKTLEKHLKKNRELKSAVSQAYRAHYTFEDIVGNSAELRKTVAVARRAAGYDEDVLITGESGTGKEMFAQAIHNASSRCDMPFIPLNCSTLSSTLIESELFGYDEGAFTGARKGGKVGLFAVADGGSLMLDEIGDLPMEMQAKLLRVLQERKVRKIGDSVEHPVNIRIIAATNKNLPALIKAGKFREDLYYRLNVVSLKIPGLRERSEDVRELADYFLAMWSRKNGKYLSFHPSVYDELSQYDWPGNIRELKHVIEIAAFACDSSVINDTPLPKTVSWHAVATDHLENISSLSQAVEDTEREIIQGMIHKYGDSLEAKRIIAAKLGISVGTLYNKIKFLLK
ncbi:MAG: sigma-54 interaction domain-containing protein [Negativicutes bacterium]